MKYPRYLKTSLLHAFDVSPVVLLIGPRQSGKTTLMKEIAAERNMQYLTFDMLKQLAAAQEDPEGFIGSLKNPVILDEVQRVPQIALPIKLSVDQNRVPGFFGLTGSANPLVAPKLNDSLAGRMFILPMWPLSMSEIKKKNSQFLQKIFDPDATFSSGIAWNKQEMIQTFASGGYPDALALDPPSRELWFDNLLTTIVERDVQDLSTISRPRELIKVLSILANRTSSLLNHSELSRISSIPYTTLNHYMTLLESLFLIIRQPAWHHNKTKRLVKMPKVYFGDTGLLINQLRTEDASIEKNGHLLGAILENFIFLELKKLSSWAEKPIDLYHYRTQTGTEVDVVLENRKGQIVGIEVKASETLSSKDWKGLSLFQKEMGEKMIRGIILYPGKDIVALGRNLLALPITSLWQ